MSSKTNPTATNEDGKPALVPKLRFPEFRGAVAWHEGQIADIAVSESSSRALNKLSMKSEGYPVYGADSCVGFIDSFDQANDYIAIVKDGSGVGRLALKKGKSSILGTLAYIKCKPSSETKLTWLYYCLNSLDLRQFIKGSGIPHIYFSDYASHQVLIPSPPEQQKIAECLSSVDELIAAQARKLDALKTHKKGLMQQLFPREGETQPRLRFPEFENAGEWSIAPLGQLLASTPDYGVNAAAVPFSEGLPKYLRITDISEDGTYLSDKMVSVDIEPTDENYLDEGDIALARTGASVGKSYRYRKEDGRLVFAGFLIRIKPAKKKLVSTYIANFLTTDVYWDWVAVTSTRSGQPGLNSTEYSSLSIPLPPGDLSEQQRIADCLSSLDDLIAAQTQTLEALKTHKQGLMQQLFPSPEAVAG